MGYSSNGTIDETDRLLALSDGVIAIAITLLVLDITVPDVAPETPHQAIDVLVVDQWREFVGFVLSFLVIGLYWTLHRAVFAHIETHDSGVVWLNLLFLLLVAFVPYGTSVFSTYPSQFGVSFVSLVLGLTGCSLALLWLHASKHQLMKAGITSRFVAIEAARFLATPIVFFVSILVAIVDPTWAVGSWLLLLPINGALNSRLVESLETDSESDIDR